MPETPFSPLAVVGIGCLFPKAAGPAAYWANLKNGTDGIGPVPSTHWNPDDYFDTDPKKPDMTYARRGGFLDAVQFDPLEFGIPPKDLEATDTTQLLGLVAAKMALRDAGVSFDPADGPKAVDRSKVSVILGVTGTLELVVPLGARLGHPKWKRAMQDAGIPQDQIDDASARIAESYVPWQENSFPGLLGNVVAGRIANKLDLHGTNCVVDAACASSLSAVHLAAMELQTGRADVAVTGGCDTFNDIFMFMCFSKTPALSATGDAKPFDANGDGTILGEGLGMVVLKRLADAEKAGDTVYAVLRGIGTSSDGKGNAVYAPSAAGQERCLRSAYASAGISPSTVELVEAHGTGTKVGDAAEATALSAVYKAAAGNKPRPWCGLGSVKSQIGHTKAAAGAASLIKVALALHYKVLPPTIKVETPVGPLADPESPFYLNTQPRPWLPNADHPRRAALSAFGFGGSNFHAVLEEHTPAKAETDWDGRVEILALSGPTAAAVAQQLSTVPKDWTAFGKVAADSRNEFLAGDAHRLVLAAHRDATDLPKLLAGAAAQLAKQSDAAWTTPDGAAYGVGPAGKLAVLFPGQGSQYPGMLRAAACTFPEMLDALAAAEAPIADAIYPPTSFAADAGAVQEDTLRATNVAQPALGAVSFGLWRVLADRFGLTADTFAGHSYGELVALAAAGRIDSPDLVKLSRARGDLMAAQRPGDPGAMLAVFAPTADVEAVAAAAGAVVANRNAPNQNVLSGPSAAIEKAAAAFAERGIKTARLKVAAAFHSPLVAAAAAPFRSILNEIEIRPGSAPVSANTTAVAYPDDADAARDLLGAQLANPVRFADQITALAADGVATYLEVGPGSVLSRLTEISAPAAAVIPTDASGGKRPGVLDFAYALARLAARGHGVRLSAWEAGPRDHAAPARPGLTVAICGANYVSPRPARPPAPTRPHAGSIPMPEPISATDPTAQALLATQQTLVALQALQQQTAALHKQFLDGQEQAQRTLADLVARQQAFFIGGSGPVAAPVAGPVPPVVLVPKPVPPPVVVPPPVAVAPRPVPPPPEQFAEPTPAMLPPPPARVPAPAPAPVTGGIGAIAPVLLAVVAEKTGYPVEMLDLGMALDADLGVDSIKRVEILAAIQERLPAAPVVKPEHLGTLHTLKDVAAFLASSDTAAVEIDSPPPAAAGPNAIAAPEPQPLPSGVDDIPGVLLAVVAEKTGYPVEMLDLGMALDADLGVDSIKRVEILAAIQEKLPDAAVVKPEHLGTLHTLKDVAVFLTSGMAPGGPSTKKISVLPKTGPDSAFLPPVPPPIGAADAAAISILTNKVGELSAPKTEPILIAPASILGDARPAVNGTGPGPLRLNTDGVERSILQVVDLDLGMMRPRVKYPEGAAVWVVADDEPLAAAVCEHLQRQLGYVPTRFGWPDVAAAAAAPAPAGLILIAPTRPPGGGSVARLGFQWLQTAGPRLRATAKAPTAAGFMTVSRLDGAFGLANLQPGTDAAGGGLAGLVKTVRFEWPELAVKAVDLAPGMPEIPAAAALVEEFQSAGPIEVGVSPTHRCTLELARTVRRTASGSHAVRFGPQDVILVTGGGRGVTAEAAVALAKSFQPTLILTGRTPAPTLPEPGWATGLSDEAALKLAIAENVPDPTPKNVGEAYSKLLAQREIRGTLKRCEVAGAKAAYFPVNVASGRSVADLLHQVKVKFGPITGLVHGAGILADKRIEQLAPDQFDAVYATKVDGAKHLLDLLGGENLKAVVLFSSTTARFGRVGQVAYAAANEVLNKIAQLEARKRPSARVVSINWGPWDGGMVTPALRKVFESEGIGLIPLLDGGAFVVAELNAAGRSVEVVALGNKAGSGIISSPAPNKQSSSGGQAPPQPAPPTNPPMPEVQVAFERVVDIPTHPVLRSHVLDGRAVLPMAVHLEWLAHAALHGNPGLVFHGFKDLRVTHGVMVEDGGSATLRLMAGKAVKQDKVFHVPVELRGKRRDREVIHSRAEVILTAALPPAPMADRVPVVEAYPHTVDEAYQYFLFHGPDLHGIETVAGMSETAFLGTAYPAPPPAEWFTAPLRASWVADPLVLDASFQMMILWSYARHGAGSLPCFAGRYTQYRRSFPSGPVTVAVRVTQDDGKFARADIDYIDAGGQVIAQLKDYQCVIDAGLNQAFRRNAVGPAAAK